MSLGKDILGGGNSKFGGLEVGGCGCGRLVDEVVVVGVERVGGECRGRG